MNLVEKFFDFINRNNVHTNTNTVTSENEKSNNTRKCIMMSNINDFTSIIQLHSWCFNNFVPFTQENW